MQLISKILLAIFLIVIISEIRKYVKVKTAESVYNKAVQIARGLYIVNEVTYRQAAKDVKCQVMITKLHEMFPSLSQIELTAISNAVWGEYNIGRKS